MKPKIISKHIHSPEAGSFLHNQHLKWPGWVSVWAVGAPFRLWGEMHAALISDTNESAGQLFLLKPFGKFQRNVVAHLSWCGETASPHITSHHLISKPGRKKEKAVSFKEKKTP